MVEYGFVPAMWASNEKEVERKQQKSDKVRKWGRKETAEVRNHKKRGRKGGKRYIQKFCTLSTLSCSKQSYN